MHQNLKSKGSSLKRLIGKPHIVRELPPRLVPEIPRPSKRLRLTTAEQQAAAKTNREAGLVPIRRDLAKRAAVGVDPIYSNSNIFRGGIFGRSAASEAWAKRAKAWEKANPVRPALKEAA